MKLYFHPVSSYSQKVLIAFYEKGVPFTPELVNLWDPAARAEYKKVNPFCKVPTLVLDDGWDIPESSIIIEYLDTHFSSGSRLIPEDKDLARQTRFRDRMSDLYWMEPMTTIFFDGLKPPAEREPKRVDGAHETIETMMKLVDGGLKGPWAMGEAFSMADCAAAPALAYMRGVHPYEKYPNVTAYFQRLAERPSVKRVLDEAKPYLAAFAKK